MGQGTGQSGGNLISWDVLTDSDVSYVTVLQKEGGYPSGITDTAAVVVTTNATSSIFTGLTNVLKIKKNF